jgi:hypothetical protein
VTELSLGSFGINCCCILILKASANFHLKCPSWFEFGRLVWLCSISWQAGTRLFGFVGAGATLGQLIGSLLAVAMAHLGPVLLLVSALMMELAARCALSVGDDDLNQSSVLRLSGNTYQTQIMHLLSF